MPENEGGILPVCGREEIFRWKVTGPHDVEPEDVTALYVPVAEVERLRELAATATRAHTRAIHALANDLDYPESERREMGAYLTQELQRNA